MPEELEIHTETLEGAFLRMPELEELKTVIENSVYHHQEGVEHHTLFMWSNLKKIILEATEAVRRRLKEKIGSHTREELLCVSALLHDIAKKETIVTDESGNTRCPGHEEAGAQKALAILQHHNLTEAEVAHVRELVRYHAITDAIFTPDNQIDEEAHEAIRTKFADTIYLDLMLLTYADAMSEYTATSRPEEYQLKMDFYKELVAKL